MKRRNWPYIHIVLDLGFIGLNTVLMRERFNTWEFEYIALHWRLFKWHGKFRLYTPYREYRDNE